MKNFYQKNNLISICYFDENNLYEINPLTN